MRASRSPTKVEAALRAAMAAKRVNLVINPEAVILATPGGDITPDLTAQLNTAVEDRLDHAAGQLAAGPADRRARRPPQGR